MDITSAGKDIDVKIENFFPPMLFLNGSVAVSDFRLAQFPAKGINAEYLRIAETSRDLTEDELAKLKGKAFPSLQPPRIGYAEHGRRAKPKRCVFRYPFCGVGSLPLPINPATPPPRHNAANNFLYSLQMRIYLDNCSFNRPFDEQDQFKIRLETEAKQFIQMQIISGAYELVWSYEDKRNAILDWKEIAKVHCEENEFILSKAKELRNSGLKIMDALHISCAIYSKCDFFITTDKQLCNKENSEIRIVNPVTFVDEMEE